MFRYSPAEGSAAPDEMTESQLSTDIAHYVEHAFRGVTVTIPQFLSIEEFRNNGLPYVPTSESNTLQWELIGDEWIDYHYDALAFCTTPSSFQFLLPAYIIFALRYYGTESNIPSFVVFSLYPDRFIQRKSETLSKEQCNAICRYLQFVLAYHDPGRIIHGLLTALQYWTNRYESL